MTRVATTRRPADSRRLPLAARTLPRQGRGHWSHGGGRASRSAQAAGRLGVALGLDLEARTLPSSTPDGPTFLQGRKGANFLSLLVSGSFQGKSRV